MSITFFSIPALYLLYAKLEESHGLARHAMAVYDRATSAVLPEEQYDVRNMGGVVLNRTGAGYCVRGVGSVVPYFLNSCQH